MMPIHIVQVQVFMYLMKRQRYIYVNSGEKVSKNTKRDGL